MNSSTDNLTHSLITLNNRKKIEGFFFYVLNFNPITPSFAAEQGYPETPPLRDKGAEILSTSPVLLSLPRYISLYMCQDEGYNRRWIWRIAAPRALEISE